jgi:hypothetical protein
LRVVEVDLPWYTTSGDPVRCNSSLRNSPIRAPDPLPMSSAMVLMLVIIRVARIDRGSVSTISTS